MRYLSVILAAAVLAGIPAGSAFAAEAPENTVGIRLVDVPADTVDDPRARSYIVDHMNPGTSITRNVEIQNKSADTTTVSVYSGAADIVEGQFTAADEGVTNDLSSWTTVPEPTISMGPGESALVPVTIDVPSDASEGEQYGAIWAQVQGAEGTAVQVSRVGIREYISVGPGNGPAADFTAETLTATRSDSDAPMVTAEVTNTGGRALDVTGTLTLSNGPGGINVGPLPLAKTFTVSPGESAQVYVELDASLPAGPWDATLTLNSGKVTHDVSETLTFPEAGSVAEASGTPAMMPWIIGGAGILLLGAIFFIVRRRRA